jgi:poly(3-hydroxybutyrate) depolymerase
VRHRALSLLASLTILLAALIGTDLDTRQAEAAITGGHTQQDATGQVAVQAQQEAARYVAAQPLPTYTFVPPPTSNGQPVRLMVALHGMGGSGADMATMLGPLAAQQGWAILAPTMPYRDYRDPELVRRDGELLPRLRALIDALPARTGLTFQPRVLFFGFSRGSQEAIRFSLMFPDATVGVAGLSAGSYTLPNTTYKAVGTDPAKLLPYPFGTGDVATICGRPFDADAARRVSYWIGVGASDDRVEDVPRQWDQYIGDDRVERAKRYVGVLQQFGAQATFASFPNAGHEVTDTMRADAVSFLASLVS